MTLKHRGSIDELVYPFIYDTSPLCDFEVLTDELAARLGGIAQHLEVECNDIRADISTLVEWAFHLNGSIRGQQAIHEKHINWLTQRYKYYQAELGDTVMSFVLPEGAAPVSELNLAKCNCKKVIRQMVIIDAAGINVPPELIRFTNLLANWLFCVSMVINKRRGFPIRTFVSQSY
jgi:ATP:cob(I)alamin adenosyltransferase